MKLEGVDGYVAELTHMIESIRRRRPPTVVTARKGLSAVEICEAEEQSVLTGKLVRLQPAGKAAAETALGLPAHAEFPLAVLPGG